MKTTKQTAVEFLLIEIEILTGLKISEDEPIVEIAKEMEKNQIINAFGESRSGLFYFNQTYKNKTL
jgi:hypothetical protein